jgi:predicted regulator of amino acid metabolism with ACT domain
MDVRKKIDEKFNKYPTQRKIVYNLLNYGLRIKGNKVYCGPIEISDSKLARAIGVDRKVILSTINAIKKDPILKNLFSHLMPTYDMKESASQLGWGVLELIPDDPSTPGIIAGVSKILASEKISIRQAIGQDYGITKEPRLYIITENPIKPDLIHKIKKVKGIKGLSIF